MNMQNYRKQIQKRIYLIGFYGLLIAVLSLREFFTKRASLGNDFYYIWGFLIGVSPFFFARLIKYKKIINDEKLLLAYYNWEHDERRKEIVRRASTATFQSFIALLVLLGLFFPNKNFPLLYVCTAFVIIMVILMLGWKLYFKRKI